jgi:molybdate transport system substrate-binding protein
MESGKVCRALFLLLLSLVPTLSCNRQGQQESEIVVAAASDLTPAFEELGQAFLQTNQIKVTFSFGSSGLLARQIENGAPMDVFAAANSEYIDALEKKGLIVPGTKALYARGRITLWMPQQSTLKIERVEDLAKEEVKRIAIANPEHAPYGMIAREALQKAGIWEGVQSRIVYGENIRQTLQFAETGNVDVAIVALSLSVRSSGRWILIPQELHRPLDQALAVIKGTKREEAARAFTSFVTSTQGRDVLKKYGFTAP